MLSLLRQFQSMHWTKHQPLTLSMAAPPMRAIQPRHVAMLQGMHHVAAQAVQLVDHAQHSTNTYILLHKSMKSDPTIT